MNHNDVKSESWDIGTGVKGYVWHAGNERAILLLQHGWGDYAERFVHQNNQIIPELLKLGVTVYAFDMRGSGRSPGDKGRTDVEQAVKDFAAARAALKDKSPLFLLGHSIGGLVVATSLIESQDNVEGAILLSPSFEHRVNIIGRSIVKWFAKLIPKRQLPVPPQSSDKMTAKEENIKKLDQDPMLVSERLPWISASSDIKVSRDNLSRYNQIVSPLLVIHGTDDQSASHKNTTDFINRVNSKDKTFYLVKKGRHILLDDILQDQTLNTILNWLDKRLQ